MIFISIDLGTMGNTMLIILSHKCHNITIIDEDKEKNKTLIENMRMQLLHRCSQRKLAQRNASERTYFLSQ